jgi:hypothetical protein
MNRPAPTTVSAVCTALALFLAVTAMAQAAAPKAQAPILVTSCGQSPGPVRITVFLKKLGIDFDYKEIATVKDIASKRYKSVIIVTGASLKGMGAAGVEMKDELARTGGGHRGARRRHGAASPGRLSRR